MCNLHNSFMRAAFPKQSLTHDYKLDVNESKVNSNGGQTQQGGYQSPYAQLYKSPYSTSFKYGSSSHRYSSGVSRLPVAAECTAGEIQSPNTIQSELGNESVVTKGVATTGPVPVISPSSGETKVGNAESPSAGIAAGSDTHSVNSNSLSSLLSVPLSTVDEDEPVATLPVETKESLKPESDAFVKIKKKKTGFRKAYSRMKVSVLGFWKSRK